MHSFFGKRGKAISIQAYATRGQGETLQKDAIEI